MTASFVLLLVDRHFMYPGYEFKAIDGLITNFHLPKSTLIMLVSAFANRDNVLHAYNEAVKKNIVSLALVMQCSLPLTLKWETNKRSKL